MKGNTMKTTRILAAFELFLLMLKPSLTAETKTTNSNPTTQTVHSQAIAKTATRSNLDQTGTQWAPFLEWKVRNSSYQGNPFDIEATVLFVHVQSGEIRKTEMFYDGNSRWKFRFTGTRTGIWTFLSTSSDPELDNLSGTVTITPNPDPSVKGFLTAQGRKFARQTGEDGEWQGVVPKVYMNLRLTEPAEGPFPMSLMSRAEIRELYIRETVTLGFNMIFIIMNNQWFEFDAMSYEDHNSTDPDERSFEVLETFIVEAHQAGLQTVIWAWGDESRKWTPIGVGGINGVPDTRLQRYIAARLGPIPGWSMGYGFDLQEWASEEQTDTWAKNMHAHFGWQHLLWGRPYDGQELDVVSNDKRPTGNSPNDFYYSASRMLRNSSSRPVIFERRFTYLRDNVWTMDNTRRSMWQFAMAGGAAGWWGFFADSPYPYPNPEQIRTHNEFWENYFRLDLSADNSSTSSGFAMKDKKNKRFIFYDEDVSSIKFDLTGLRGYGTAIVVDTKKEYQEINLGFLVATPQTWVAPYKSDWAIAVGQFGDESKAAWSAVLTFESQEQNAQLSTANSSTVQLVLGGHDAATDGLDIGFDKPAPPPPPGGSYYAAFKVPETKIYLSQDIRGWHEPFDRDIDWPITVVSANDTKSELRWNSESFPPQGSFFLKGDGKEVDMRRHDSFSFTGNTTLTISYRASICLDFDFPIDDYAWYLISLPMVPDDNSVTSLFPDAFAAFTWNNESQQYTPASQIEPGHAYWLLFLKASQTHVCGRQINAFTKKYRTKGWDLVGSVSGEAPLLSDPEDAVAAMFHWDVENQLLVPTETNLTMPGQGYWILVAKVPSSIEVNRANQSTSGSSINKMARFMNQDIAADLAPPAPPYTLIQTPALSKAKIPETLSLMQNYPNPFNPETTIEFHLPEKSHVTLKIYSILGREVKSLVDAEKNAGIHRSVWNAKDNSNRFVGSGIYLLQMQAGEAVQSRRIILLK
jgi:hypothetical protein